MTATSSPSSSADNLPIPVDAVNEWGLPTEPYTFVVDGNGKVSAKFEGISAADELPPPSTPSRELDLSGSGASGGRAARAGRLERQVGRAART